MREKKMKEIMFYIEKKGEMHNLRIYTHNTKLL